MFTGFGKVFFPLDDDVAVGNVGIPCLGNTGARYVENGLFTALRQLIDDVFGSLAVLKQTGEQVLKPQLLRLLAIGQAQTT
ncbi:MAG: hypothetical protein Q8O29_17940 [Polaromonas sp.]|nr:hypothetical protein [Polaromonas sp.]